MLNRLNKCDIYVGMWCIYMLQGVLYPSGIFNQALQILMLLWGIVALFQYVFRLSNNSTILRVTLILLIMYTIYGGIHIMFGDAIMMRSQYLYLQASLNSLMPIFLFFSFAQNGLLTNRRIKTYLPIFIVVCILLYYKYERMFSLLTDQSEITNNIGYMFVTLIPFLSFYSKKPIIQYLFLSIILVYVFMGMKRGAILIGLISSIVLIFANLKESSRSTRILFTLLSLSIVFGINIYIDYMMNTSDYFAYRFEQTLEGNTSGRDIIYTSLWNTIRLESRPLYFYFGRGADSTLKIAGNYAHQDWLETFCNNGLLGVIILFSFFYTLGKNAWLSRKRFNQMMFYSFSTMVLIIFIKTLFSMSIQDLDLSESMLIGYFAYWMTQTTDEFDGQDESEIDIASETF